MASTAKEYLQNKSNGLGESIDSLRFALSLDEEDPLKHFRERFLFPRRYSDETDTKDPDKDVLYLASHSLGLKAKTADGYVQRVLQSWEDRALDCHFNGYLPAAFCENYPKELMAKLTGAKPSEIAIMNTLTVNLHVMMAAFYKPTTKRYKIIIEEKAFPSDQYCVTSVLKLRGYETKKALIQLKPRQGQDNLELEDIVATIEREGDSVALILLPGVQYYTGQVLDVEAIVKAGHAKGCVVGIDAAHAVGNVKMRLHDWNVDFSAWCTYKYLSSGPGGIGAIFVHEKHTQPKSTLTYMQGWWGNNRDTKFDMNEEFEPCEGAERFQLSNQSPVNVAILMSSLEIFIEATTEKMVKKQQLLNAYFDHLFEKVLNASKNIIKVITPRRPSERGSQISLQVKEVLLENIFSFLKKHGVTCDLRRPSVIRVSFMPLYNSFYDAYNFVQILQEAIQQVST